jgi:hypothetical protein
MRWTTRLRWPAIGWRVKGSLLPEGLRQPALERILPLSVIRTKQLRR